MAHGSKGLAKPVQSLAAMPLRRPVPQPNRRKLSARPGDPAPSWPGKGFELNRKQ